MFGIKPMITGSPVTISSDGTEPTRFDSISKASTSTGIPYFAQIKLCKNVNTFKHDIKKSFFDDLQKQNDDIFFYY